MSNKSGTSEQVISLPKGGGELKGLGESFSPDLHSGTGNFSVPISLPAGRNGFQPELGLVYSTGNGNSCFGLGWQLNIPGISRKTNKGIPRYFDDTIGKQQDTFLLSGAEDLVPIAKGANWVQYRPRTEGLFALIRRFKDTNNDFWEVKSKEGLISYYGTPNSKGKDPATCFDPEQSQHIFDWKLSKTIDPFGNFIEYSYQRDLQEKNNRFWNQLYLERIRYLDYLNQNKQIQFLVSVNFEYENERLDPFSVYTSGFEVRTEWICDRVVIMTHPENEPSLIVRSYDFIYENAALNQMSLLRKIQVKGHQNGETEAMPPIEFSYSNFDPSGKNFTPISGKQFPTQSLANADTELIDLFGNGLPDIIQMNGVVRYWKNLGNGVFDLPRLMKEAPAGVTLADPNVQFMDANGEGRVDLVVQNNGLSGYFPTQFDGTFDKRSFKRYKQAPSFNWQDANVKLVDLTGDGITDVLRSGSRMELFLNDPQDGWTDLIVKERKNLDAFPNVDLADSRVRLADMTGDNMQDIVLVHHRKVEYWPCMGYGKWGKRIQMRNAPQLPRDYDPRRLLIGDIAGDGPHDIIYIDHCKVFIWINQNGNSFSDKIAIDGTPPISDVDAVRLMDLHGTGLNGILWSADQRTTGRDHYFYLDLTGGIKPYVLNEMNNNMGAITKVEYRPSTYYYLKDEQSPTTRWKTPLPFPMQVVSCVEVIDEISRNKLVTEYHYRHGYWDGGEREFRGFGRVEQIDTQTFEVYKNKGLHGEDWEFQTVEEKFYTPPTKTITWFHQGPVGEGYGDWTVCDYSDEYWQGDSNQLDSFSNLDTELEQLNRRREKRDAIRTLRGSILRTEVYSLDDQSNIPWTVSESIFTLRPEGKSLIPLKGMSGAIFFPMAVAQRTTNWERGDDPMTKFSFTQNYDSFGQAQEQIAIACPRGWRNMMDNIAETDPFLATYGKTVFAYSNQETEFATVNPDAIFIKDRSVKSSSFEILHQGNQQLIDIKNAIRDKNRLELIAQFITYYDGNAFEGLPFGEIGNYGLAIRSESLIITPEILEKAWRNPDGSLASLPVYLDPNAITWSPEYPDTFKNTMPNLAGYSYYDGTGERAKGYWAESSTQFDFQVSNNVKNKGLPIAQKDALGRIVKIEYDEYHFLPIKSIDPIGLTTAAEYDYRLFQPKLSIDPNDNVSMVKFSPLGFVTETYLIGKEGKTEGDALDRNDANALPGSHNEYNWLSWMNDRQPISVKSIVKEHHLYDTDVPAEQKEETITTVEFSDGYGRIVQTRTQAEDVLFGDDLLGNEVLSEDQTDNSTSNPFSGRQQTGEESNVVVSGWQIYDNKGQVVQKYEPFYSVGFGYADMSDNLIGQKVEQYYDPIGRVIKTCNPDGSIQQVVFGIPNSLNNPKGYRPSPWEAYTYDENDNAHRSHADLNNLNHHWNTPASVEVDALGRTIKAVARNREKQSDGTWTDIIEYITLSTYDIRGNLLMVRDALDRKAFEYTYDLTFDEEEGSQVWRTDSIDAGTKRVLFNVLGLPIEGRDSKGSIQLNAYDTLNRPTFVWARDKQSQTLTARQKFVYNDENWQQFPANHLALVKADNRLGTLLYHFDESGRVSTGFFDFKGNLLFSERQVLATEKILPLIGKANFEHFQIDWEKDAVADILDLRTYESSTSYDALNRPKRIIYPRDVSGTQKVVSPTYNRAGALESIQISKGTSSTVSPAGGGWGADKIGVHHIAYNAKGQRTLIAYKNGILTRYAYDNERFWLKRLRTEKYESNPNSPYEFTPKDKTLQDIGYEYDLIGNITKIKERGKNLGIVGAALGKDALDRVFDYDPIYRLVGATGREHITRQANNQEPWLQEITPTDLGAVTNPNTQFYTRQYGYDAVGNMLQLNHSVSSNSTAGFTRTFDLKDQNNQLNGYEQGSIKQEMQYDVNGNLIEEATSRHYFWNHSDALHGFKIQASGESTPSLEARYIYDASGERVKKVVWHEGGKVTTTTYLGGVFEYHTEGSVGNLITKENNTLHLMDDKSRIALIRIGTTFDSQDNSPAVQYQLGDHLGNAQVVVNEKGDPFSREEHYPYGGTSLGSFAQKRYCFTGKERDEESGLHYHSARYYAPWGFRWISIDKLSLIKPLLKPYLYGNGNVINGIDSNGQDYVKVSDDSYHRTLFSHIGLTEKTISSTVEEMPFIYSKEELEFLKAVSPESFITFEGQDYLKTNRAVYINKDGIETGSKGVGVSRVSTWIYSNIDPVIPKKEFVGFSQCGDCFKCCNLQLRKVGLTTRGPKQRVQIFKNRTKARKGDSGIAADDETVYRGISYIHQALENGDAIRVGVDYNGNNTGRQVRNVDNLTDHFVTIIGRGIDETGEYFRFYENAVSNRNSGTHSSNKFYYNAASRKWVGTSKWGVTLTITMVRPNTNQESREGDKWN